MAFYGISGAITGFFSSFVVAKKYRSYVDLDLEDAKKATTATLNALNSTVLLNEERYNNIDKWHAELLNIHNTLHDSIRQRDKDLQKEEEKVRQREEKLETLQQQQSSMQESNKELLLQIDKLRDKIEKRPKPTQTLHEAEKEKSELKSTNTALQKEVEKLMQALGGGQLDSNATEMQVPLSSEHKKTLLSMRDTLGKGKTVEASQFIAGLPYVGEHGSGMFSETGVLQLKNGAKLDCKLVDCVPYPLLGRVSKSQQESQQQTWTVNSTSPHALVAVALTAITAIGALVLCFKKKNHTPAATQNHTNYRHSSNVEQDAYETETEIKTKQCDLNNTRVSRRVSNAEAEILYSKPHVATSRL